MCGSANDCVVAMSEFIAGSEDAFVQMMNDKAKELGMKVIVTDHHTIEDCGIVLGKAFKEALQDKKGIRRYGSFTIPMDETLCNVTLDLSSRSYLVYHCELKRERVGSFSCEMVEEFLRAFAFNAGITLHVNVYYGTNDHHKIEAIFKALGQALKQAVIVDGDKIFSSKGVLEG